MRVDVYFHSGEERSDFHKKVLAMLHRIENKQEKMMADLDVIIAEVTEEGTQIDSLLVLMAGIKQQLADALAGVVISPETQAKIDAVFAGVEQNKKKVIDALNATP